MACAVGAVEPTFFSIGCMLAMPGQCASHLYAGLDFQVTRPRLIESRDERQAGEVFVSALQEASSVINDAAAMPQTPARKVRADFSITTFVKDCLAFWSTSLGGWSVTGDASWQFSDTSLVLGHC